MYDACRKGDVMVMLGHELSRACWLIVFACLLKVSHDRMFVWLLKLSYDRIFKVVVICGLIIVNSLINVL